MSYILVEDKQAKMLQLLSKKSFLKKILLYIHTCTHTPALKWIWTENGFSGWDVNAVCVCVCAVYRVFII